MPTALISEYPPEWQTRLALALAVVAGALKVSPALRGKLLRVSHGQLCELGWCEDQTPPQKPDGNGVVHPQLPDMNALAVTAAGHEALAGLREKSPLKELLAPPSTAAAAAKGLQP